MARHVIRAARALTPMQEIADAAVVIEDGKIASIGRRDAIEIPKGAKEYDARQYTLTPGFVDIHIHGAGARDVMEASAEALATVTATVAKHGTTTLIATTVSAPVDETCRSLEGIARYIASDANRKTPQAIRAQVQGIHLEGPFISAARRGVHPPAALAEPTVSVFNRFLQAANGCTRILTLAPELPGAREVIDAARKAGVTVALGHTDATYAEARMGIEHGARHAVHVFNAMRPFSHRETGVLGAILTDNSVTAEIIADGVHVDDPAIQILLAAKGSGGVVLVSDGTAATGMPDGTYKLGPFEFTVSGGVCRNAEGRLAGSTLTLDKAIKHMVSLGLPLREALQMATLNPAKRIGIEATKGVLAPGADADLVFLTSDLQIARVVTRGTGL
jgi:N-acetylglucosamine-6-phosphate deacetylase